MALAISVGFVVDDAIVMIENIDRNIARGMTPLQAASPARGRSASPWSRSACRSSPRSSRCCSWVACRDACSANSRWCWPSPSRVSALVSLTLTPMTGALGAAVPRPRDWFDRLVEGALAELTRASMSAAAHRAAAQAGGDARVRRDAGRDRAALYRDAEGLLPAGRYGPRLRLHRGVDRHVLPRHGGDAAARGRYRDGGPAVCQASARPWAAAAGAARSIPGACGSA